MNERLRRVRDIVVANLQRKNSVYLMLSLSARALNAITMFIAIQRFAPSTFGEMSYLQATAVSTVAFSSFGIDISMNARLTRKSTEAAPLSPTILAGCALACAGMIATYLVVSTVFASQLNMSGSPSTAKLAVDLYSCTLILMSLVSAMSFALIASVNVGVANLVNAVVYASFALLANKQTTGANLIFFTIVAQTAAIFYLVFALSRSRRGAGAAAAPRTPRGLFKAASDEVKVLVSYGAKQILVVSVINFSQWLIQRKIVFGAGGTSENAVYSIGNQVFNIMTYLPTILSPIIVSRLAGAGDDVAMRRRICLSSLRLFAGISAIACIGVTIGLRLGTPFLPPRYAQATEIGLLASLAASASVLKTPFSLFFLSELKASREIASAVAGAIFMIIATSMVSELNPTQGTVIRLLGCVVQAVLLWLLFYLETRRAPSAPEEASSAPPN